MSGRRFGVEEELLLVDPATGLASGVAATVLEHVDAAVAASDPGLNPDGIEKELQQEQIETGTEPVRSLDELRAEILRLRRVTADAARRTGVAIAALATSPTPIAPSPYPDRRYRDMVDLYRLTAAEQLTCGMHIHVEVDSPEEGVAALDRVRGWLAVLLALSVNSPFWQGRDTGHESFRTQAWSRWPTAGPTGVFGSHDNYRSVVAAALDTGTLVDDGMLYFDARLGRGLPTVELRVSDVCLYADDALLGAVLARALVDTAVRDWRSGIPAPDTPTEVLRLAAWRASRSGLHANLVHPHTGGEAPAWGVIAALRSHVEDALVEAGDADAVDGLLAQLRDRGTGADVQRAAYDRSGDMAEVVRDAVRRTVLAA